jgi:hypothetical protein
MLPMQVAIALVLMAAVVGVLRDLRVLSLALPETKRQVPRTTFSRGLVRASLRFEVELGTGWLTYVTSTLRYVLVTAVVVLRPPLRLAVCAGIGFGIGRAAMTVLRLLDPDGEAWDRRMTEAARWIVPVCSVFGVMAAAVVVLLRAP